MAETKTTYSTPRARVERVYQQLLDAWNRRDARRMAALFTADGHAIGFDGSEMHGPEEIAATIGAVFANHQTASYVSIVRDVTFHGAAFAVLRAHVGMVPPGQHDINPATNAVQTIVAVDRAGEWRISLLQNTPAAYHGRPDEVARLTAELRAAMPSGSRA